MAWPKKTQALVERLAFENKAEPRATARVLKHLAARLPSLRTIPRRLTPRDRFAYALDVLRDAYCSLEPRQAHRLFRAADLGELEIRMAAATYLVEGCHPNGLPLYSIEELADRIIGFRKFISDDRDHLVRTGLPSRFYEACRWLWYRAANLYVTRRTLAPLPAKNPVWVNGKPIFYRWARLQQSNFGSVLKACSFKAADPVARLTLTDERKLIELRGRVLDAKATVLGRIATRLRGGSAAELLPTCMEAIRESLTTEEIAFCLRCDSIYSHVPKNRPKAHPIIVSLFGLPRPIAPGGLESLFQIVWHAEKELSVGTMCRTREALGELVVEKDSDNVLAVPDQPGHYFALIAGGRRRIIDRALDRFIAHDDLEAESWSDFQKRLQSALKPGGNTKVLAWDREFLAKEFQAIVESAVAQAVSKIPAYDQPQSTNGLASDSTGSQGSERVTVRFPSFSGLRWEEVAMEFVSNDSIKVTARKRSKRYTFAELGFKDGRKGDLPDTVWGILRAIAKAGGSIDWDSKIEPEEKRRLKPAVAKIRKRLITFMRIKDDPFHPYRKQKAYMPKFALSDSRTSEPATGPQSE